MIQENPNNTFRLYGVVLRDPQIYRNRDGSIKVAMTVAVEDEDGESGGKSFQYVPIESFYSRRYLEVYGSDVETAIKKGDTVSASGRIEFRTWTDKSGAPKSKLTLNCPETPVVVQESQLNDAPQSGALPDIASFKLYAFDDPRHIRFQDPSWTPFKAQAAPAPQAPADVPMEVRFAPVPFDRSPIILHDAPVQRHEPMEVRFAPVPFDQSPIILHDAVAQTAYDPSLPPMDEDHEVMDSYQAPPVPRDYVPELAFAPVPSDRSPIILHDAAARDDTPEPAAQAVYDPSLPPLDEDHGIMDSYQAPPMPQGYVPELNFTQTEFDQSPIILHEDRKPVSLLRASAPSIPRSQFEEERLRTALSETAAAKDDLRMPTSPDEESDLPFYMSGDVPAAPEPEQKMPASEQTAKEDAEYAIGANMPVPDNSTLRQPSDKDKRPVSWPVQDHVRTLKSGQQVHVRGHIAYRRPK